MYLLWRRHKVEQSYKNIKYLSLKYVLAIYQLMMVLHDNRKYLLEQNGNI